MSFIVFLIDGMTEPAPFRAPTVAVVLWFFIAFAAIFPEFYKMEKNGTLREDSQLT